MDIGQLTLPPPPATSDNQEWVRECLRLLDAEIEPRGAQIARITQEVEMLAAVRETFLRLLDNAGPEDSTVTMSRAVPMDSGMAAPAPRPSRSRRTQVPEDIDLTGLNEVADLDGAEGEVHRQLVCIAKAAPDKLLNTTQAARLLLRLGVTTTPNLHSVRVSVQRALDTHSKLFERVRPATYKYTGHNTHRGNGVAQINSDDTQQETTV